MKTELILYYISFFLIIYIFILWKKYKKKWNILKTTRTNESFSKFALNYKSRSNGEIVARTIYNIIQKDFLKEKFPIKANDDIENTLGIACEDFDELIESSLSCFGVRLDDALKKNDILPIKSVDDLINMIIVLLEDKKESNAKY